MASEDVRMGRDMDNYYAWMKAKIKRYEFTLNVDAEKDIIKHLETIPNKRAYLIGLIRKDIKETSK